ncbi:MAG: DNRLRE domain-containing protein [Omnitrophica WOR_2 bacterium]
MRTNHVNPKLVVILLVLAMFLTGSSIFASQSYPPVQAIPSFGIITPGQNGNRLFLPFVLNTPEQFSEPKVNIPYFSASVAMNQTAIFWFGRVTPNDPYVDVRTGYNPNALVIHIAVIDRRLWCSTNDPENLALWDSVELFLDKSTQPSNQLNANAYRFTGQLSSPDCPDFTKAFQGGSSGWQAEPISFTARTGWRGNSPNDNSDDRGWTMDFQIPFASLGMSSAPKQGEVWKLAVLVHDRNDGAGNAISSQQWPDDFNTDQPTTWGDIRFGLPSYTPPPATQEGVVTVRNKLNGISVMDGQVGGSTVCGEGLDYWTQWGETSYPGSQDNDKVNIQNQDDVADWPCFSKYYVTFPLNSIPPGKVILSARLRLHQFGNSGSPTDNPPRSYIQVFTVGKDWSESSLTWNNAPQMTENVSEAWVDPLPSFPGWPGVLRTWDVSRAVAMAYISGEPLRLALYSADEGYHTGKYFVSSDTGDWNAEARPELQISLGQP